MAKIEPMVVTVKEIDREDIVKTHLLYLQNLEGMSHTERNYFSMQYLPYLMELCQTDSLLAPFTEESDIEKTMRSSDFMSHNNSWRPKGIIDECRYKMNCGPVMVKLNSRPKGIHAVCMAKDMEHYKKGEYYVLQPGDFWTVDINKGAITFNNIDREEVFEALGVDYYYSVIIDYDPETPGKLGNYEVGEDGES